MIGRSAANAFATSNGGQFEFLPVTVGVTDASFSAPLRVGAHAGLTVDEGKFAAGLEVALFADVAKIETNITATPDAATCKLPMSQKYSFELGAEIGATVAFQNVTYGPLAETFTPIWSTVMTDMCANEAEATAVSRAALSSPTLERRDDELVTTTTTTEITHTGISCPQPPGPNCPLSLRSTTKYTETRSLTTAIPSGEEVTFPVSIYSTVSTEAFGSNVQKLASLSGSPTSYTEPTSTPGGDSNADSEKKGSGLHAATCNVVLPLTSSLLALVLISAFTL
jgi:hypothetical protein